MTVSPGFICLNFGTPGECQNCGGWTRANDEDGQPGPFPGDSRYCSEDCYADAQRRTAAARARMVCCPECGFDNQEHDPEVRHGNGRFPTSRPY